MANRNYSRVTSNFYDKHAEHLDQSPLGKLQQHYWTTKQQVIKKLGKKEDEFIVLSDAELDSKLDLFEAIQQTSTDLLRVIEMYQEKLVNLSIEEGDMSGFLKSQSTYDTKTKAGKMMAAVSKSQHFAAQQRSSLRLPLVRLYNEVETFRYRAITDTYLTVKKMENARTEYRGALLWMKNVSMELDPDATRKLEKFRRVQAQVKKNKLKFDRLKTDVTQKIDLLSASRCNMFSHVLVNYQRTLISFWEKTARTFNAVAEAFKGYQYYEFNIIKDLVEPSKRVAEMVNNVRKEKNNDEDDDDYDENFQDDSDEKIMEKINDSNKDKNSLNSNTLINFDESNETKEKEDSVDEVNQLIDLMTLNEASTLNEQLKELEQLETEKMKRNTKNKSNKIPESSTVLPFDLGAALAKSLNSNETNKESNNSNLVDIDLGSSSIQNQLKNFKDLLNNANDEFEREWQSAFASNQANIQENNNAQILTGFNNNSENNSSLSPTQDEFGFFVTATQTPESTSINDFKSIFQSNLLNDTEFNLNDLMATKENNNLENTINILNPIQQQTTEDSNAKSHSSNKSQTGKQTTSSNTNNKNLSAWYDLFAELDPLKNPDAIGQKEGIEEERNC